ncbi:cell cycle RNA binding protein whi3, partial [Coemansia sp. RSA 25]
MSAATAAMMTPMGAAPYSASAVSTPGGMMLPMATTRSVNSNDQNPPCNTLYVGNLPIGAKEDELWMIFQHSLGYKRMSYKAKPNSGPMCFVEFESIDFATLAMNELDGRMLTNSVGSGIRLSYSKNPLGVRPQGNPTTPTALSSSAAQAAASVAVSSNGNGGGFSQHLSSAAPSPYGYSAMATPSLMQNPQQQQQRLHGVSPVHQGISASAFHHHHHHKDASSPSPPAQAQQLYQQQQQMAYGGHHYQHHHAHHHHHQLSMSSSSATSPMPSPGTAVHSGNPNDDMTAVPKDALSFLHQPIHQLHKQATSGDPTTTSTGPSTPPLTST